MARTLAPEAHESWEQRRRRACDDLAGDYAREREGQYSFQVQKGLVLRMLAGVGGRVLDAGCGPAVMEPALLERGFEVEAIDVSPEMIRLGGERLAGHPLRARCRLEVADLERLRRPDAYFNAIIAMGVLEYVPDHAAALGAMHRVLKPSGTLALTVPSRVSAFRLSKRACELAADAIKGRPLRPALTGAPGENRCVPWRLDRQLERSGFEKRESGFCNFVVYPLCERAPVLSDRINRALSWLSATPLGIAGNQYVLKAVKVPVRG